MEKLREGVVIDPAERSYGRLLEAEQLTVGWDTARNWIRMKTKEMVCHEEKDAGLGAGPVHDDLADARCFGRWKW